MTIFRREDNRQRDILRNTQLADAVSLFVHGRGEVVGLVTAKEEGGMVTIMSYDPDAREWKLESFGDDWPCIMGKGEISIRI